MRLRWKIALLVFCITLAAAGAGGVLCARQMQKFTLEAMADSEAEKLAAIGSAFRQAGTREDLEQMGELARDAYLSYQFDRCYPDGYGLMKDGVCIANKTDYEILNYQALEGEYMVQELDGARVYCTRFTYETIPLEEGFFEAHRRYLDIHLMLQGEERVDVAHPDGLTLTESREDGDFYAYQGKEDHSVVLAPGDFLVVFPGDAHRIKLQTDGPRTVSKAVFKVLIDG